MIIKPTSENIDELFEGMMIPTNHPLEGKAEHPGWKCRRCGWTIGSEELPPEHNCEVKR